MIGKFLNRVFFKSKAQGAFSKYLLKAKTSPIYKEYCKMIHGTDYACFNMLPLDQLEIFYKEASFNKEMTVLDLGCGTGELTKEINKKYNCNITGCDFAATFVSSLEQKASLHFKVQDIDSLKLSENTYDIIYCIDSFYFLANYKKAIKTIKKALKRSGKFILIHSFTTQEETLDLEESPLYLQLLKESASFNDVTISDYAYWNKVSEELKKMESNFYENSSGELWKVKHKEMLKFEQLHSKGTIKRFIITLQK